MGMQSRLPLQCVDADLRVPELAMQLQMFLREFELLVAGVGLPQKILHVGINRSPMAGVAVRPHRPPRNDGQCQGTALVNRAAVPVEFLFAHSAFVTYSVRS